MDVDEGGVRLAMLASMGTMLVVALASTKGSIPTAPWSLGK